MTQEKQKSQEKDEKLQPKILSSKSFSNEKGDNQYTITRIDYPWAINGQSGISEQIQIERQKIDLMTGKPKVKMVKGRAVLDFSTVNLPVQDFDRVVGLAQSLVKIKDKGE